MRGCRQHQKRPTLYTCEPLRHPFRREVDVRVWWPEAVSAIANMLRQLPRALRRPYAPLLRFSAAHRSRELRCCRPRATQRHAHADMSHYSGISVRRNPMLESVIVLCS